MSDQIKKLSADIVSAYITHAEIDRTEMHELIGSVYQALADAAGNQPEAPSRQHHHHELSHDHHDHSHPVEQVPAVDPKKSVFKNHIVCLEDGLEFKTIKRHIQSSHGMTVDEYKLKWGLPRDYPVTAPGYAKTRSRLAKEMGLGKK